MGTALQGCLFRFRLFHIFLFQVIFVTVPPKTTNPRNRSDNAVTAREVYNSFFFYCYYYYRRRENALKKLTEQFRICHLFSRSCESGNLYGSFPLVCLFF